MIGLVVLALAITGLRGGALIEAAATPAPAAVIVDDALTAAPAPPAPPVALTALEEAQAAAAAGDWRSVVIWSAREAGIDERTWLRIADCETGGRFDPNARNPSGASGLLQQLAEWPDYWTDRAVLYGFPGASPFDGLANAIVSARQAAVEGFGPWSCY